MPDYLARLNKKTKKGALANLLCFAEFLHIVCEMLHAVLGQLEVSRFLRIKDNTKKQIKTFTDVFKKNPSCD